MELIFRGTQNTIEHDSLHLESINCGWGGCPCVCAGPLVRFCGVMYCVADVLGASLAKMLLLRGEVKLLQCIVGVECFKEGWICGCGWKDSLALVIYVVRLWSMMTGIETMKLRLIWLTNKTKIIDDYSKIILSSPNHYLNKSTFVKTSSEVFQLISHIYLITKHIIINNWTTISPPTSPTLRRKLIIAHVWRGVSCHSHGRAASQTGAKYVSIPLFLSINLSAFY